MRWAQIRTLGSATVLHSATSALNATARCACAAAHLVHEVDEAGVVVPPGPGGGRRRLGGSGGGQGEGDSSENAAHHRRPGYRSGCFQDGRCGEL